MSTPMENMSADAHDKDHEQKVVLQWWSETIGDKNAATGPRAELRRAGTLEEVVFVPLYHDLRRRLAGTRWRSVDRIAMVAGVLARVREHDGGAGFADQMAAPRAGATARTPRVSPSRFRRLLRIGDEAEDLERLFEQVRRVVSLLNGRVNVTDLAASLYWWNAETRKRWALAYYEHVDERALKTE